MAVVVIFFNKSNHWVMFPCLGWNTQSINIGYNNDIKKQRILLGSCVLDLGLAGQSVNEGCVGEHTILILGVTELSEQLLDILLGDLVSQVG